MGIDEITLVNSTSCRFIKNTLQNGKRYNVKAELCFKELISKNQNMFQGTQGFKNDCIELAKLNLARQALFLEKNLTKNSIKLTQMIYDKELDNFYKV